MGTEKALAYLKRNELLQGLEPEALRTLVAASRELELEAGTLLMSEGDPGDQMYVILDGRFEVSVRGGSVEELVARRGPGDVVGELALLGRQVRTASVRAVTAARVLEVGRAALDRLLESPGAAGVIYRTSLEREHKLVALLARREKLAGLGTIAAGLAHELNNPAAALRRSAKELGPANDRRDASAMALFARDLTEGEMTSALELGALAAERFAASEIGFVLGAAGEDELIAALEEIGVEEAWAAAGALTDAGWAAADLNLAVAPFLPHNRAAVADWLAADAACRTLLREIVLSSKAVSNLVESIREYSHLDRAARGKVDLHASLNNTLAVMRHSLKQAGVEVTCTYGAGQSTVEAFPNELSQVWTNLIDNAVDAMPRGGHLTLATRCDEGQVTVEFTDDGEGITDHAARRLFEPFFTTKGVGEGTGLGLYISNEIVTKRHGGSLSVDSRPGLTTFRVVLPRCLPEEAKLTAPPQAPPEPPA